MKFTNKQFGELEIEPQYVIDFPGGIIGFEECRKFLIVHDEDSEPFRWLVSLEDAELSFPLLDPSLVVDEYPREVSSSVGTDIFVVATLHERLEDSTINLRSPIIIDTATQTGKQILLEKESLQLQFPLIAASAVETEE